MLNNPVINYINNYINMYKQEKEILRHTYNQDKGLRKWRTALNKLEAGHNAIYNVSVIGDSITEGNGAEGDISKYNTHGYLGLLRSMFDDKFEDIGRGVIPIYYPTGLPLWNFTGWANETGYFGFAGFSKRSSINGEKTTLQFNGTGIGIVYPKRADSGSIDISIDGNYFTTINQYSDVAEHSTITEITGLEDGEHTLEITSVLTTNQKVWVHGAFEIKGQKGIRFNMVGRSGVGVNAVSTQFVIPAEIDMWQPVLTIIALTANDYTGQTSLVDYEAKLQLLITEAKKYGDVLLVSTGLRQEDMTIQQSEYAEIQYKLASQNNVAYLDMFNYWKGDADYAKNQLGYIADTVHPTSKGHESIARAIYTVLTQ